MTRLWVLTFLGPKRWTEDIDHPHESPPIMVGPLMLLAIGSAIAGGLMASPVAKWLEPPLPAEAARPARRSCRTG